MHDVLDDYDPAFVSRASPVLQAITRVYFRYELRGRERLPGGPVLFVGNHSGLGTAELLCMLPAMRDALGEGRHARGLMMDLFLRWPGMAWFWKRVGAIAASPANGRRTLARGLDCLVFPGGDIDTCRPFFRHREVEFGSRRGYVRLALETGVPIVPIATIGSHLTWLMLPGGALLARALRLKRLARIERLPIAASWVALLALLGLTIAGVVPLLPWYLLVPAVLVMLAPFPVRITSELLEPIDVRRATAHLATEAERLEEGHRLVHGALSHAVRKMRHGDGGLAERGRHELPARRGPACAIGRSTAGR